ncbi:MAG: hypothetical protein KAI61_05785, partial [Alphaproteobacteria bacterium]|nr:hypothetical protein [Alphaproteobacteria bacterium]
MGYEGGDDGDVGASAWPGFVDILSSVLIMFVFFLMITAVTLNFHILIFKGKIKDGAKIVIAEVK